MNNPKIILADEPTAELDVETEAEVMEMLRDIHKGGGVTMLMVSHNYDLATYATRRFKMTTGRLFEESLESCLKESGNQHWQDFNCGIFGIQSADKRNC